MYYLAVAKSFITLSYLALNNQHSFDVPMIKGYKLRNIFNKVSG